MSMLSSVQVATAIRGAIIQAKMSVVPVRRGYWGNKIGKPHTVPTKVRCPCTCMPAAPSSALPAARKAQVFKTRWCPCTWLCEMAVIFRAQAKLLVFRNPCEIAGETLVLTTCAWMPCDHRLCVRR